MIVGMFIVCWAGAIAFWRFGRVEEKWGARLKERGVIAEGVDV